PTINKYEEINEHFRVHRMRRYPATLEWMGKAFRFTKRQKWPVIPIAAVWGAMLYFLPWITIILSLLLILLYITKLRVVWIRGALILRMIIKGHRGNYDIYHSNDLNTMPQGYISAK